ncbi:DivIVA domain-containing protein [Lentzea sp. BCCO 10_0798]|uniref:Cell wall synthesis protein Wag31 n=1 Tax=Lentzea kristufekii TaxID=3095430 RepID=A0ABU4U8W2_9PSEU|nr:DivIVA domain-containing protein [Lentzea sp. BCCO 10_0798]MDX8056401.1 DivIVA domain-containing protein [Lentzea sp. BCCO 10_0798]
MPYLRPADVRSKTFRRKRQGYDPDQVNEFLQIVADALAGRLRLNPDHVRTVRFATVPNGYDPLSVDGVLHLLEFQVRNGIVPPTGLNTGEDLYARKLPRSSTGYDRAEVDAFIIRAAANLDGRGAMTSTEVRNTRFSTTSGLLGKGYQVQAVDTLLDDLEQELRFRGR